LGSSSKPIAYSLPFISRLRIHCKNQDYKKSGKEILKSYYIGLCFIFDSREKLQFFEQFV